MEIKESNAALEAKREYHRKWRANNRERCRMYAARYWEKVAQKANNDGAAGEKQEVE